MKKLLFLCGLFATLVGLEISVAANNHNNVGLRINSSRIISVFYANIINYIGECNLSRSSGSAISANIRFISKNLQPEKNLKVRLTNLNTGREIERSYKKKDKGSNDFKLKQLGNQEGIHSVEYAIYNKKTDVILETGTFRYQVEYSFETNQVEPEWKLELFCASEEFQLIEDCNEKYVAQRERKYCLGERMNETRNERLVN